MKLSGNKHSRNIDKNTSSASVKSAKNNAKSNAKGNTKNNVDNKRGFSKSKSKSKTKKRRSFLANFKTNFKSLVQKATDFESLPSNYKSGFLISIPTFVLICIGTIAVISATSISSIRLGSSILEVFIKPSIFFIAGLITYFVAKRFPINFYKKIATSLLWLCVGLQFFTLLVGRAVYGNTNWISIFGVSFQPAEFMKFALVLYLALRFCEEDFKSMDFSQLKHYSLDEILKFAIVFTITYLPALLGCLFIVLSRDMGTFMVIAAFIFVMIFFAGARIKYLVYVLIIGAASAVVAILVSPSRRVRVAAFIFGEGDVASRDSQRLQSLWGLASGGFTGLGAGAGREKWGYLPAAKTDFIYSVIGEEFGLLGTLLILALFILLAYGLFSLMFVHDDPFVKHAVGGIVAWIIIQALINILVVIGFAPVLGVPLPLISSGGSALIITMAALGFCVRAAEEKSGLTKKYRKFVKKGKAIAVYQSKNVRADKISEHKRSKKPKK